MPMPNSFIDVRMIVLGSFISKDVVGQLIEANVRSCKKDIGAQEYNKLFVRTPPTDSNAYR